MAEITAANFKLYQCTTWTEGSTHGGVINTAAEIASSGDQVIFDDVSDAERIAGDTEYRKVFFRNENADTVNIKMWIETPYSATNETISVDEGTASGIQTTVGEGADGTYVTPTSIGHADVLDLGAIAQNTSKAVWIKRVVSAAGNGYVGDSFQIKFGMY